MPISRIRTTLAIAAVALAATAAAAQQARASAPHTVLPGETLWSIAASYNFTTRTVAAFNGLSEDSPVYAGETIQIPTEAEGEAALASAGVHLIVELLRRDRPPPRDARREPLVDRRGERPLGRDPGRQQRPLLGLAAFDRADDPGAGVERLGVGHGAGAGPPPPEAPYWVSPIYCPCGAVYLASNAAAAWEAMRQESLSVYGIDLYPDGTLSGYRSYAQQLYLYDLYLSGQGSLAAVPGTSVHEYGTAVDLAEPYMRTIVDEIGGAYGWAKIEAPDEWWHVNYVGP